jgi:hypothetical protein
MSITLVRSRARSDSVLDESGFRPLSIRSAQAVRVNQAGDKRQTAPTCALVSRASLIEALAFSRGFGIVTQRTENSGKG